MADITPIMVKNLREQTGAGMMDCKKALTETNGDFEAAVDWLRTKGLSAAAKKSGRVAAEGLVAVAVSADQKSASMVEVNSETDFVARNEQFQGYAQAVAQQALNVNGSDVEALKAAAYGNGKTVQEQLTELVATIGENMNLRRYGKLSVSQGVVAAYVHSALAPNLGKIGVLVALESTAPVAELQAFGKQIAMHIAAAKPDALHAADVDQANLERERAIFREQATASGKPAEIIEKMVEGRIRKYYEEVVLHEQPYVITGEGKVSEAVIAKGKEHSADIKITGFLRFHLGEGIEKEETDFAAEVKAVLAS